MKYDERNIQVGSLGITRSKFTWTNDKKFASDVEVFIIYVDAFADNAVAEKLREQIRQFGDLHKEETKFIVLTSD